MRDRFTFSRLLFVLAAGAGTAAQAASWQDASYRETLQNDAMKATIQAGQLVELQDKRTGTTILRHDPATLPANMNLFGEYDVDLDQSALTHTSTNGGSTTEVKTAEGVHAKIRWSMEPGNGDLVLQLSAKCPQPVKAIRSLPEASIRRCAELVKSGQAQALVSMGNTGAALAAGGDHLHRAPRISKALARGILRNTP